MSGDLQMNCDSKTGRGGKIVAVGLLLCVQSGDDIFGAAEQLIMAPLKWETARQESLTQPPCRGELSSSAVVAAKTACGRCLPIYDCANLQY